MPNPALKTLEQLSERYPAINLKRPVPLAKDTYQIIRNDPTVTLAAKPIFNAMRYYTRQWIYLAQLKTNAPRFSLNGALTDEKVSESEAQHAKKLLKQMKSEVAAKRQEDILKRYTSKPTIQTKVILRRSRKSKTSHQAA